MVMDDGAAAVRGLACLTACLTACSDQPGRFIAVFVVSPVLAYKGFVVYDDTFIKAFSVVLFAWDLWWLIMREPVRSKKQSG